MCRCTITFSLVFPNLSQTRYLHEQSLTRSDIVKLSAIIASRYPNRISFVSVVTGYLLPFHRLLTQSKIVWSINRTLCLFKFPQTRYFHGHSSTWNNIGSIFAIIVQYLCSVTYSLAHTSGAKQNWHDELIESRIISFPRNFHSAGSFSRARFNRNRYFDSLRLKSQTAIWNGDN